ncbi:transcriptional regulator [Superficieibacter electus]|uniref:Transcriptional regulator n=1 Tax=Superficieibacter electus TaxID=2022662 RepID=A0A2P5GQX7_9ENTR|nr:helix-turn-helix transcriptional regulator [Superficieibacter electus]POP43458.1 transcriptional regulator [Superficieibacter electus]POP48973.1 transcriptional regulator [Superficieibacter electus]
MSIQYIKDEKGNPQYVVIPYDVYFQMRLHSAETETQSEAEGWEDIPYEHDKYDDVGIPDDIITLMSEEKVSLQAAWRIYKGLSQQEVAEKLGISQSAVSQLESPDSRPQKRTREKLAALYGCTQEQISLRI